MRREIPAPGYTLTKGRKPKLPPDTKIMVQIRLMGWCDSVPWPVEEVRWKHDGTAGDVVAVKMTDDNKARQEGRQANGSYE